MADPDAQALLADAADRYSSLETAYCQDRWAEVVTLGRRLLDDLKGTDDPLATALQVRAQLLMGHAYLHGLGNRDAAEDHYRMVLGTAGAEAALRHSAEEGLQACNRPVVRPQRDAAIDAAAQAAPAQAQASGERPMPEAVAAPDLSLSSLAAEAARAQEAAAPWLQAPHQETSTPLIPDLVEEPELLEVRRAEEPDEIHLDADVDQAAAAAARLLAASARQEALAEIGVEPRLARTEQPAVDEPFHEPAISEPAQRAEPALTLEKPVVVQELPSPAPVAEPFTQPAAAAAATAMEFGDLGDEEEFDQDLLEGLLQVTLG